MMTKRAVLFALAATASACGDSSTEPPSPVASVTLPLDSLNTVPDAVIQLRASVRDTANAPLPNEPVRWSSTDTAIATVDTTGLVTAKASGSARIVARSGARADTLLLRLGLITFTTVAAGDYHACGLTPSGAAYCWGWGVSGELGIGDTLTVSAPVKVLSALTFSQIAPGYRHSCALTTAGAVYCWGSNDIGQVGIGARDTMPHLYPEPISGGGTYSALNAGDFHTCALTSAGAASCWGYGHYGQLGNGDTVTINATPVAMAGGLTFLSLSGGQVHSCGIAADSAGYCWGLPDGGRLGSPPCGSSLCHASPQPVSGGLKFIAISVGEVHSCGVAAGGAAWCWGGVPAVVSGGQVFDRIAAGTYHTCAVTSGGSVYCWGDNGGGQLGDGTLQSSATPVPLAGGLAFAAISAATNYSCGVTTAGTAYCWGTDLFGYGVLGVGGRPQTVVRNVPTRVLGQP